MRKLLSRVLLAGAMTLTAAVLAQSATAQTAAPPTEHGMLEVSVTYGATLSNVIASDRFWTQGGSAEVEGLFYHGLGVVADISGMHTGDVNSSSVSLDLVTATFGPRYTWAVKGKYEFFGQGLLGEANGFHGLFPTPAGAVDSSNSMAVQAGGGMNVALSPHMALRAFEMNWLHTQLPNSTSNVENNLMIGAGVALRFR